MGFSLGARAIFFALEKLAKDNQLGVAENVSLIGTPISTDPKRWQTITRIIAGRVVNCYSTSDWILNFLYRTTNLTLKTAGLQPVNVLRAENVDATRLTPGQLHYKDCFGDVLDLLDLSGSQADLQKLEEITEPT